MIYRIASGDCCLLHWRLFVLQKIGTQNYLWCYIVQFATNVSPLCFPCTFWRWDSDELKNVKNFFRLIDVVSQSQHHLYEQEKYMRTIQKIKLPKNRFKSLSKTKAKIFSCLLNVNLPLELVQIIVIKLPGDYNNHESFIENSTQMLDKTWSFQADKRQVLRMCRRMTKDLSDSEYQIPRRVYFIDALFFLLVYSLNTLVF